MVATSDMKSSRMAVVLRVIWAARSTPGRLMTNRPTRKSVSPSYVTGSSAHRSSRNQATTSKRRTTARKFKCDRNTRAREIASAEISAGKRWERDTTTEKAAAATSFARGSSRCMGELPVEKGSWIMVVSRLFVFRDNGNRRQLLQGRECTRCRPKCPSRWVLCPGSATGGEF